MSCLNFDQNNWWFNILLQQREIKKDRNTASKYQEDGDLKKTSPEFFCKLLLLLFFDGRRHEERQTVSLYCLHETETSVYPDKTCESVATKRQQRALCSHYLLQLILIISKKNKKDSCEQRREEDCSNIMLNQGSREVKEGRCRGCRNILQRRLENKNDVFMPTSVARISTSDDTSTTRKGC